MKLSRVLAQVTLLLLLSSICLAQDQQNPGTVNPTSGPPNLMLLVHQEVQPGKASDRQRLEISIARAADRLNAPNFWLGMQSMTGTRETVFLDPFDSFERLEQAGSDWARFFSAHQDVAHMRDELDSLLVSDRTTIAIRRDDLGYLLESIDLTAARFLRIIEVRVFPGHENDFSAAARSMADARANLKINSPFVVYQVNAGLPTPAYLIVFPLSSLSEDDNSLTWDEGSENLAKEESLEKFRQIARDSISSTLGNLYMIHPEVSHVPEDFASEDPDFWRPTGKAESTGKPPADPGPNYSKKTPYAKPNH